MSFWTTAKRSTQKTAVCKTAVRKTAVRKSGSGFTLVEVLVYAIIALLLGTLLVLFLERIFRYHAYIENKMKLSEVAGMLVRELKGDLQKTYAGNIQLSNNGSRVVMPRMEAVVLDQTLKWQDNLVFYEHNSEEQKVYRWQGDKDSNPFDDPKRKSWPFVNSFVVRREDGSRKVNFEVEMLTEDGRRRTQRYKIQGSEDVMGGFPVQ